MYNLVEADYCWCYKSHCANPIKRYKAMTEEQGKLDPYLLQLVLSLQAGAMQQMGKVASPVTGEVERDLILAQHTIDILEMVQKKMKGNLTDEEEKLVGHVLYELRLNYVDESQKASAEAGKTDSPETKKSGGEDPETPAEPKDGN